MKSLCRIASSVCASLCVAFFVSSCSLALDPAKTSFGTTVSLHLSSLASAVSGRAIIQGTGYLYIQTGSTASDAKLYGPWQTGSGQVFSTSEIPAGSYDSFAIVYMDAPLLTSPVFVDEINTTILSALQSRLYDHPDTLLSCSCALLSGISIRSNRDNPLEATLVPATTKAIDISGPSSLSVPDASSGTARSFVKLNFIDVMKSGQLVDSLSIVEDGSGSVSRMALYALNGKLISAGNKDSGGTWTLSYPSSGDSSCYLYLEYQGAIESSMVDKNYVDPSRGVWYVNNTGGSDGSDAAHPCTLTQAIQCINQSTYSGTQTLFLTGDVTMAAASSFILEKGTLLTSVGSTPYTIKAGSSSATVSFTVGSTAAAAVTFSNCIVDGGNFAVDHLVSIAKGTFTLGSGATLQNNASTASGGGVYVSGSTAKFVMDGGTISSCSALTSGGAVYMSGGTFNMTGGTISSCSALNGGAVGMTSGTFTMSDGKIDNCSTSNTSGVGGAIYITSSSIMNMNGGTISFCKAKSFSSSSGKGGAIYLDGSTFNMSSGLITNCSASGSAGKGGGLYLLSGAANFSGGSISVCGATDGGAMYLYGGTTDFTTSSNVAKLSFSGNVAPDSNNVYKSSSAATITVNGTASTSLSDFSSKTGYSGSDITWN